MANTLHTVEGVAAVLNVAPKAVFKLIASGQLRAVNVGTGTLKPRWRISQTNLEDFLEGRAFQPAAAKERTRRRVKPSRVTSYF